MTSYLNRSIQIHDLLLEPTTQWPKEKRTKNNLQNNAQKTIDRAIRTPLKTGDELRCFRRL